MLETTVATNFKLVQKLGVNPFYEVFRAIHTKNDTGVAVKMEKRSVSESHLYNESKIIKEIQGIGPDLQTPAITYDGKYVLTPFSGFQRQSSGALLVEEDRSAGDHWEAGEERPQCES